MIVNKKHTLTALILLIMVVVAFLFIFNNDSRPVPNIEKYIEQSNTHFSELGNARKIQEQLQDAAEIDSNSIDKYTKLLSPSIVPIDFHGIVIDQYGNPVQGASVEYSAGGVAIISGTGRGRISTDSNGMFGLKTTGAQGATVSIGPIRKAGYEYQRADDGAPSNASKFGYFKASDGTQSWTEYSQDNPYKFVLWKLEKQARMDKGEKRYYFKPDGSRSAVDLQSPMSRNRQRDMTSIGHFDAAFTRSNVDWKLELSAPGGGFIEIPESQIYMNVAPEAGYSEVLKLSGLNNSRNNRTQKRYFIKTKDGLYGNLLMTVRPYYKEDSFLKINYALNIEGTRGLSTARWQQ
jgi:hypothetical protein